MISDALVFLKDQLNAHLDAGIDPGGPQEETVIFVEDQNADSTSFKSESVTVLLINIEEENTFRSPNQFIKKAANGRHQAIVPELHLNLQILFVSRFQRYQTALTYLSRIIQYFQKFRVFDHESTPQLPDNIQKLVIELVPLPITTQNEIWSILRTAYQPSVSYRVKMVIFESEASQSPVPIQTIEIRVPK